MSKAEFVLTMLRLRLRDRERYQELRDRGWSLATPPASDNPN